MITQRMLVRLSICPCGYSSLLDSIQLGHIYEVDDKSMRYGYAYKCGKCGRVQFKVAVIDVRESTGEFRPLPLGLFESGLEKEEKWN